MTDSTRKKIIKWFWIVVTFPVLLLVFMILLVWMFADIPSFKDLENPDNKLATQVIAEDGEILTTFHIENRTYVSYDEISPNLVHAAVATEDVRFYKHSGIDFKGLGLAGGAHRTDHRERCQDDPAAQLKPGRRQHDHPAVGEDPLSEGRDGA